MGRRIVSRAVLLLLPGCAPALPTAELGPHPKDDYTVVEYPPPPANVELPGSPPEKGCVWVDGYWQYAGRSWEWRAGEWVKPPAVCRLAPASIRWEENELRYRAPRWYPEGQALVNADSACPSPPRCGPPRPSAGDS
jgi:hypothetical protein